MTGIESPTQPLICLDVGDDLFLYSPSWLIGQSMVDKWPTLQESLMEIWPGQNIFVIMAIFL